MAPHSSTLAWNIPPEEEPGRLQSMWSIGVGHNWATSLSLFTFLHWRRKWPPTPVFLPGESRDGGAWWAAVSGVTQSRTRLKRLSSSSSNARISWDSGWKALIQCRLHSKYCVEGKLWGVRLVNGCGSRILDSSALLAILVFSLETSSALNRE